MGGKNGVRREPAAHCPKVGNRQHPSKREAAILSRRCFKKGKKSDGKKDPQLGKTRNRKQELKKNSAEAAAWEVNEGEVALNLRSEAV